jgi:hypothetical protein
MPSIVVATAGRFAATELPIAEVDAVDDLVDCLERAPVAKLGVLEQQLEGRATSR